MFDPCPCVVYLAPPRNMYEFDYGCSRWDCLVASLKLLNQYGPQWPVLLFNEGDYTKSDQDALCKSHPRVTLVPVDFRGQERFYVNRRPTSRVGQYGYCMMCRFFCGPMQWEVAGMGFSHYMRLDDDSYIMSKLNSVLVDRMLSHDYVYRMTSEEDHRTLFEWTCEWMRNHDLMVPDPYSSQVPYNNFHVSKTALWLHPMVTKYLQDIEAMHGCVSLGWTDASIHKMVVKMLGKAVLPTFDVAIENGFAYRHNQHHADGWHTVHSNRKTSEWGPPETI